MTSHVVRLAVGALATCVACSPSTSNTPSPTTTTAAAVSGAPDTHCGAMPVVANPAVCHVTPDAGDDGGADGGAPADNGGFGPTNYNAEADDDDCKYHVKWESTAVTENADVTFKITVTNKKDGTPVAKDKPYAELLLDDKTPAPNSPSVTTETAPGIYTIGPVRFNRPGQWTSRFHFHAECVDTPESPHGHGAFFVKVP